MNKKLPVYKLTIDKDDLESGVSAIALVEQPAIELDFFAFKNDSKAVFSFKSISEDKKLLAGYLMIPDKLIYRNDGTNEYFVQFDSDTISTIAEKFNREKIQSNFNLEHSATDSLKNVFVKENWIIESQEFDKSKLYGFEPIIGAWFGIIKVNNDDVWTDYIKTGNVKGFSVEGSFEMAYAGISDDTFKKTEKVGFDFDNTISLLSGQELAKQELAKGNTVYIITSKDTKKSKRVFQVAAKLGIPSTNIRFANSDTKVLDLIKGLGLSKWYDNSQSQIDFINQNSSIKTIKFELINPLQAYFKRIANR